MVLSFTLVILAFVGVFAMWNFFNRHPDQILQIQYYDSLLLVPLGQDWNKQSESDRATLILRHRVTGESINLIPGPQMDARTAMDMLVLMQKYAGIKINDSDKAIPFVGKSGAGFFRTTQFGEMGTSMAVLETPLTTINMIAVSGRKGGRGREDALRALKGIQVISAKRRPL